MTQASPVLGTSRSPTAAASTVSSDRPVYQAHACESCSVRKIRCDKQKPCGACTRAGITCEERNPPPRKRRKRVIGETDEHEGVPQQDPQIHQESPQKELGRYRGHMIDQKSGQRYYEHGLLAKLGEEYGLDPNDTDEELLTDSDQGLDGPSTDNTSVTTAQPFSCEKLLLSGVASQELARSSLLTLDDEYLLRTKFLANVHPLTMVLHGPTITGHMWATPRHCAPGYEVLEPAMYACAILSMTDAACVAEYGERRLTLLSHYQTRAQQALVKSNFMLSTDIRTLQAFTLLLTSMSATTHPRLHWTCIGTAIRLAQGMGLHRDGTRISRLTPFQTELRRRLWWYLITLEIRLNELAGISGSPLPKSCDTQFPLNINDTDLYADMQQLPEARHGWSDMSFCLAFYEISNMHMCNWYGSAARDQWASVADHSSEVHLNQRIPQIEELENRIQNGFLRYCDLIEPIHVLTTTMARASLMKIKTIAFFGRIRLDKTQILGPVGLGDLFSDDDKKELLRIATKTIEYDNLVHKTPGMEGYLWRVTDHIPWGAIMTLFRLLTDVPSAQSEEIWKMAEQLFENRPKLVTGRKTLNKILGDLFTKAWAARPPGLFVNQWEMPKFVLRELQRRERVQQQRNGEMVRDAATTLPHSTISVVEAPQMTFEDPIDFNVVNLDGSLLDMPWFDWISGAS